MPLSEPDRLELERIAIQHQAERDGGRIPELADKVLFGDNSTPYRCDLGFGTGADDQVFLLNKHDGNIRLLVPDSR